MMYGDVPQEHKDLAEELREMESFLESDTKIPAEFKAKSYVCLAHDWYAIGMEENAEKLLLLSEKVFPGYFSDKMLKHIQEDEKFHLLVKNLSSELIYSLLDGLKQLGDKNVKS